MSDLGFSPVFVNWLFLTGCWTISSHFTIVILFAKSNNPDLRNILVYVICCNKSLKRMYLFCPVLFVLSSVI